MTAALGAVALIGASFVIATPQSAAAPLLTESFQNGTLADPNNWVLSSSGTTPPCLTAGTTSNAQSLAGGSSIAGCAPSAIDTSGSGTLRLTPATVNQAGTLQFVNPISTLDGLDIEFATAQYASSYNGFGGADGISFFLKRGDNTDNATGRPGGSLGYGGCFEGCGGFSGNGIPGGLLGIGFDWFGNFSNDNVALDGAPCTISEPGFRPKSIAVRGPDTSPDQDGSEGFCYLGGTGSNSINYDGGTRSTAQRKVRVQIDPASTASPKLRVYISAGADLVLPSTPNVELDLPAEYLASSTFKFGFSGSTGGDWNNHEVWGLKINPAAVDLGRCKGTGSYDASSGKASFNLLGTTGKQGTFSGSLSWKLEATHQFEGTITSCKAQGSDVLIAGSGALSVKVGKKWVPTNVDIAVVATPASKSGTPGAFSITFDPAGTPATYSGSLRTGSIQVS